MNTQPTIYQRNADMAPDSDFEPGSPFQPGSLDGITLLFQALACEHDMTRTVATYRQMVPIDRLFMTHRENR